jgi:hypothetical protein
MAMTAITQAFIFFILGPLFYKIHAILAQFKR